MGLRKFVKLYPSNSSTTRAKKPALNEMKSVVIKRTFGISVSKAVSIHCRALKTESDFFPAEMKPASLMPRTVKPNSFTASTFSWNSEIFR
jgi:hypothetical protein